MPTFVGTPARVVRMDLERFVRDASHEQVRAWDDAIPWLQRECRELVHTYEAARTYTTILEYELPRESRRPDVVVLENGVVVVLELKGKEQPSQADLDQVSAYARDLRAYHAECEGRPVHAVLVPSRAGEAVRVVDGVTVVGPAGVHRTLQEFTRGSMAPPLAPEAFLRADAYAPLPTLVRAARNLFAHEPLPTIKRAAAATDPAVDRITAIAHEAAATGTRRLVLLTGVPGSGKTLVGLRLVHAGFLDDLAVPRATGPSGAMVRPTVPAVFLSGNGPLVQVLQDALKDAGGGGKTFVRDVKNYVRYYSQRPRSIPLEHLLVFDEAQRAWDAEQVDRKNAAAGAPAAGRSEPEHFVEFTERIPGWCVIVGLVGSGQEIHTGEEGGLGQWRRAIEGSRHPESWTVHAPAPVHKHFNGSTVRTSWDAALNLDTVIRYHLATKVDSFVRALLGDGVDTIGSIDEAGALAQELRAEGHQLLLSRDLEAARRYARDRYENHPQARYGLLASSKAKGLVEFGVDNEFQSTKRLRVGRWYNAPATDAESCCRLDTVATEFSAQGLELDLTILAWGSDYMRRDGHWTIERASKTRYVKDPFQIRRNVYRVLLTRGRDGTVVFVPPDESLDETAAVLQNAGFRQL